MKVLAVIPARYESSRLPGKPLADLCGKSLIRRVYENVQKCKTIDKIIVATDDGRILHEVEKFGGLCQMTDPDLPSGTDRVATVAKSEECDIVVNVQGDEPFLDPSVVDEAVKALIQNESYNVSTVGKIGLTEKEINSPDTVKVITNKKSEAIYFSRHGIPYIRDKDNNSITNPSLKHIGLYVFRKYFLNKFTEMKPTVLEQLEKLEQLRIIENGEKIYIAKTEKDCFGIDTPEDLTKAKRWLQDEKANSEEFVEKLKENGLVIGGINEDLDLVEICEYPNHPYFIGCQFHPELKSRVNKAHPLFKNFVKATIDNQKPKKK